MKKYEFTGETRNYYGRKLHRIKALRDFSDVKRGDLGGWIEKEENLSHSGDAWVSGNAQVFNDAWVYGNAWVYGDARISGEAWVSDDARVFDNAQVYGDAWVSGDAWVLGNAQVYGKAWVSGAARVVDNAEVFGNALVSGNAQVFNDAWVYGNARVYGDARISGEALVSDDARVSGKAKIEYALRSYKYFYDINRNGDEIRCGYESMTYEDWLAKKDDFIEQENLTDLDVDALVAIFRKIKNEIEKG